MISRIWCGWTTFDKTDEYVRFLQRKILPELRGLEGYKGAYILRKTLDDRVEFLVFTMWESMVAIRGFAGENPEIAVVPPEGKALLVEFDATVKHYEIVVRSETP